ncbi:DUF4277 domain-containing protein [Nostoc sp.]|uniref:DUF4277 domain-containing protein n=1 Tax=Nostoc sp. TaxID=1180 RepID=UPI002FFC6579
MKTDIEVEVQDIDHLGLIAGIIDDIGIVEIIDQELGIHEQEKVSAGQVVKAMIINCMGFLTAPLYLCSELFAGKATEYLIGEGVKAEYLNDSRIGRVLEQLYEYGITLLFLKIASAMVKQWGIKIPCVHIDGTSLSVHGKYVKSEDVEDNLPEAKQDIEEEYSPVPITITHGYSRDHSLFI